MEGPKSTAIIHLHINRDVSADKYIHKLNGILKGLNDSLQLDDKNRRLVNKLTLRSLHHIRQI